jgi:hypothetical protein
MLACPGDAEKLTKWTATMPLGNEDSEESYPVQAEGRCPEIS